MQPKVHMVLNLTKHTQSTMQLFENWALNRKEVILRIFNAVLLPRSDVLEIYYLWKLFHWEATMILEKQFPSSRNNNKFSQSNEIWKKQQKPNCSWFQVDRRESFQKENQSVIWDWLNVIVGLYRELAFWVWYTLIRIPRTSGYKGICRISWSQCRRITICLIQERILYWKGPISAIS